MTASQPITDAIVQDAITNAVQNVCRTLVKQEVRLVGRTPTPPEGTDPAPAPLVIQVMGNVGFVGDINGIVYLCMSDDFAAYAVGEILGMTPNEVLFEGPEVIKDAIGEVTNMTVGGFKNALCDLGFPCKLTLPTIVRGANLKAGAIKGASRHIFRFECSGRPFLADIQLKIE